MIRRLLAFLLLINLALANTPVYVLHTLFANHKDSVTRLKNSNSKVSQLTVYGFHCQVNSNVTTAPYLPTSAEMPATSCPIYFHYPEPLSVNLHFLEIDFQSLRAPPVLS